MSATDDVVMGGEAAADEAAADEAAADEAAADEAATVHVHVQALSGQVLASCVLRPNGLRAATDRLCADVARAIRCHSDLVTFTFAAAPGPGAADASNSSGWSEPWDKTGRGLWVFARRRALRDVALLALPKRVQSGRERKALSLYSGLFGLASPWYVVEQVPLGEPLVRACDYCGDDWLVRVECSAPFGMYCDSDPLNLWGEKRGDWYVLDIKLPGFVEKIGHHLRVSSAGPGSHPRDHVQGADDSADASADASADGARTTLAARVFFQPATRSDLDHWRNVKYFFAAGYEYGVRAGRIAPCYAVELEQPTTFDMRHFATGGGGPIITQANFRQAWNDDAVVLSAHEMLHRAGSFLWLKWAARRLSSGYDEGRIAMLRVDHATLRLESNGRSPRTAFYVTLDACADFHDGRFDLTPTRHDALLRARSSGPFALVLAGSPTDMVLVAEADWDDEGLPCFALQGTFFLQLATTELRGRPGLCIDVLVEDYDPARTDELVEVLSAGAYARGGAFHIWQECLGLAAVRSMIVRVF